MTRPERVAGIRIAMIAAMAENGVIGAGQDIPWRLPSDFAWFKRMTMGKPMIMGRKQFETFAKPLPGRAHIVLTRQSDYAPAGVTVVHDLETGLARAGQLAAAVGVEEIMVIGGGDIYAQAMAHADRLYISHVALSVPGDVYFPSIDPAVWQECETPEITPSARDVAPYTIKIYRRRATGAH